MRAFSGSRNGCAGVLATMRPKLRARRHGDQPPELRGIRPADLVTTAHHGGEECSSVATPFPAGGVLGRRNQAAGKLLGVVWLADFGKRIPLQRAGVERVQDDIAAPGIVVTREIAALRIGDDRAITPIERGCEQLPDGGRLARSCGADQLEVLDLIARSNGHASNREWRLRPKQPQARRAPLHRAPVENSRPAFVRFPGARSP